MTRHRNPILYLLTASLAVYLFAHWDALTSTYVINDDVRQQIYWMQQWADKDLFTNDPLTQYAKEYVPWGVKSIYWIASHFMNPVQFTKVVTGLLFITTALLLFQLVSRMLKTRSAILSVCVFFFFGHFMGKISGGLSQSFAYPLLLAYLLFLIQNRIIMAGVMILIQSVLNPYIFLLCLFTHFLFMLHALLYRRKRNGIIMAAKKLPISPDRHFHPYFSLLPIAAGILMMAMTHVFLKPASMGELVSRADMIGKIEYTKAGRYHILPEPSFAEEIIRIWELNLPFKEWGPIGGGAAIFFLVWGVAYACIRKKRNIVTDIAGFRTFGYLFIASILLYILSYIVLMDLFLPRRYIEFSFNIFFCVGFAMCLKIVLEESFLRRIAFSVLITLLILVGALRLKNVGIYDYSESAPLCDFFKRTPKETLIAGPPDIMDNILTFSCRKAFITYELSHTWMRPYWDMIKGRTYGFFRAYYALDPDEVHEFCRVNHIDYMIIRDEDFKPERIAAGNIYFEPFGSHLKETFGSRVCFAVLDKNQFPPLYQEDGIRVIKPE